MATEVQEAQQLFAPVIGKQERDAGVIALRAMLRRGELVDRDADLVSGLVEALQTAPRFGAWTPPERKLELESAAQDRLGKFVRHNNASRQAALANYPRSGTQRMAVLHRVAQTGTGGATRDELVLWIGWPPNVVTPRVKELVDGGWLEVKLDDTGAPVTRKTRAKQDAEVLALTTRARSELRRRRVPIGQ